MPEATPPSAKNETTAATTTKSAKCIYCGERMRDVKVEGNSTAGASHPGGPNACIARALLKLRRSVRSLKSKD